MEKQLIPELRFPEFEDEWIKIKLNESIDLLTDYHANGSYEKLKENVELLDEDNYALMVRTTNFENKDFKTQAKYISETAYNYLKKSKVYCDDIIINKIANAGATYLMPELNRPVSLAMNLFLIRINNNSYSRYIYYQLKVKEYFLKSLASGTGTKTITKEDVRSFKINIPTLPEQQKIASFLSDVDDKITKLTKKKTLLEQYKKGVMQKIFNQELRFKDDDGNAYPDWEKKKLGELLDYEQPTKYIVSSTDYSNNYSLPVLTAGKSFILGFTNETDGVYNKLPTIIFDDFTMANKFVDFNFKVKSSAMKILQPNSDNVNMKFVYEAIQMINYPKGDEHKRFWISEYSKIKIGYPCKKEQNKIANFLSDIDLKIEALNTKIVNSKNFKKGLLQKMFV